MAHTKSKTASKGKTSPAKPRPMPEWTKAPATLVDAFATALHGIPDIQARQMFGCPAAFANTKMFAGLFQDTLIVRLSEPDRDVLRSQGGQTFEPMPGRPMREYVVVPAALVNAPASLRAWLDRAHAYAASLPPKAKKKRQA